MFDSFTCKLCYISLENKDIKESQLTDIQERLPIVFLDTQHYLLIHRCVENSILLYQQFVYSALPNIAET